MTNYFWWAQTWHMRTPLETLGPGSMVIFELRDLQVCRVVFRFNLSYCAFHMRSAFNSGIGATDASGIRRHRLRLQAVCSPLRTLSLICTGKNSPIKLVSAIEIRLMTCSCTVRSFSLHVSLLSLSLSLGGPSRVLLQTCSLTHLQNAVA